MRYLLLGWLLSLALLLTATACRPREEPEQTTDVPTRSEQVVVTRLVMVTPEGAGPAIPGTMPPPTATSTPAPTATTEVLTITLKPAEIGSPERPVRLLFPADVPAGVLETRGDTLSEELSDALGISVQTEQLESYEAVVDMMCTAPGETVGFLPPMGYVLANERCDVQVGATAMLFDLPWQIGMIVARADSGIRTVEDLADKRWARPATLSLTRDLYFRALLADAGIELAEVVEHDSENSAMLAVFNGEADFATATFLPPILPYEERQWVFGEDEPDLWRRLGIAPERHPVGYIVVIADPEDGGYRIRDARAGLFDVEPGIFTETRITSISEPMPNDTVVFGADFPLSLARDLQLALIDYVNSEACAASICSTDFYGWSGLAPVEDVDYDPVRFVKGNVALSEEELWAALGQ